MTFMETREGVTGRVKKPRKTMPAPDSVYVAIKGSKRIIARMKIIAASRGISFAEFSREVLTLGLDEYLKDGHLDLGALEAMETAANISAARGAQA